MDFNGQQSEAVAKVADWLKTDKQVFRLFGYAGTGKTTIAREFAHGVGGEVLYGAYTGKAALVLARKGCPAETLHRLIYVPSDRDTRPLLRAQAELKAAMAKDPVDEKDVERLRNVVTYENKAAKKPKFKLNDESRVKDARLLVVDEVSMVGRYLAEDLLSFGTQVLVLGDPAQLPPVRGSGYFTDAPPDCLLTEIHRQAAGSPVLVLADHVRRGGALEYGDCVDSRVVPRGVLSLDDLVAADQVIVGTNKARRDLNAAMRTHLGLQGSMPAPGDRLICLRNNHDIGLLNGGHWVADDVQSVDNDRLFLLIRNEETGDKQAVIAWRHYFDGREDQISHWEIREHEAFDFGYAITCHKAQGSQWDHVLIVDESHVFRQHARRWLYTAITRAAKRVTIVKKG